MPVGTLLRNCIVRRMLANLMVSVGYVMATGFIDQEMFQCQLLHHGHSMVTLQDAGHLGIVSKVLYPTHYRCQLRRASMTASVLLRSHQIICSFM